jgi:ABC-type amino acid transport substrate-binding protein
VFSVKRLSLATLAAGFLTAACQPLPQPFQADSRAKANDALIRPIGEASLFIPPISGLPQGSDAALAETLAKALNEKDVPASATGRNRLTSVLTVRLEPRGSDAVWSWEDRAPDGSLQAGETRSLGVAPARLAANDTEAMKQAAATMATAIAEKLNAAVIESTQTDARPVMLAVKECEGAPGDGNRALRQAMREILILGGQNPLPDTAGADYVIGCRVNVWQDSPTSERVTIEWVLLGANGNQLGDVKQANRIPRGQLAGTWGNTAHIIAKGGWQGLSEILESRQRSRPVVPPAKS